MNIRGYIAPEIPKSERTYKAQPSCQPITASAHCTREGSPGGPPAAASPWQHPGSRSLLDKPLGPPSLPTVAAWCLPGQGPEPAIMPRAEPHPCWLSDRYSAADTWLGYGEGGSYERPGRRWRGPTLHGGGQRDRGQAVAGLLREGK